MFIRLEGQQVTTSMNIYNAIYDLRVLPSTFDLIGFLVVAYSNAKKLGYDDPKINLIFITSF